jgi:cell division protein FtsQ
MRPVRADRTTRARKQPAPRKPRSGTKRAEPASSFGKRTKKPGPISRTYWRVRGWFNFRRPMMLLGLGLVLLALIAALFVSGTIGRTWRKANDAVSAVVADAGFGISEVHLAGNARTQPDQILAALGFKPGESIFAADLQSARLRLKKLDWVADADVQRRYPDAISVHIVEKLPFALWKSPQGTFYVVERAGGVITGKDVAQFAKLPLLLGDAAPADAADLVDAAEQHRAILARTRAYQRVSQRRWNLILDGNVIVKLPETNWRQELDTLEHMIVDQGVLERSIGEIDLRIHSHYFFGLKGQQAPQPKSNDRGSEL